MLQNLIIAFEAVAPMFLTIAVGYGIKKMGMLDSSSIKQINRVLFKVLFPCLVFCSLYGESIEDAFDAKLIGYSIGIALLLWLLTIPFVMKIEKSNRSRGAMIQAINRSNFLVVGFPVVNNICGSDNTAAAATTIIGMLLLSNIMSVTVLEVFRGSKPNPFHILKEIFMNPIIIATVIGVVFMLLQLKLPYVVESTVTSLNKIATPLALLVMGASIDIKSVGKRKRNLLICLAGKLVVIPGTVAVIGILLGFRDTAFVTLLAFFSAAPTTTSFTMADQMNSDSDLARDCVVFGSALVAFTMFCWIFIFKTLGIF